MQRTLKNKEDLLMNQTLAYRRKKELRLLTQMLKSPDELAQSSFWRSNLRKYPSVVDIQHQQRSLKNLKQKLPETTRASTQTQKEMTKLIARKYPKYQAIRSQSVLQIPAKRRISS